MEESIKSFLNEKGSYLSAETVGSTRATGDAIQHLLAENFGELIGPPYVCDAEAFSRRAMADLAFTDEDDLYYVVDVKTHRSDTAFNMPNLVSIERLRKFYEDDRNHFVVLLVKYSVDADLHVVVEEVRLLPIEWISWDCLTIGALGWGQLQLANANNVVAEEKPDRQTWMIKLGERAVKFYEAERKKTVARQAHFEAVRDNWKARS